MSPALLDPGLRPRGDGGHRARPGVTCALSWASSSTSGLMAPRLQAEAAPHLLERAAPQSWNAMLPELELGAPQSWNEVVPRAGMGYSPELE